jgi:hypothetical protein
MSRSTRSALASISATGKPLSTRSMSGDLRAAPARNFTACESKGSGYLSQRCEPVLSLEPRERCAARATAIQVAPGFSGACA